MNIYLGSDHGGFALKKIISDFLSEQQYTITDCGPYSDEASDYPDFAVAVGQAVRQNQGSLGILFCRSGEGMEIVANKLPQIRAALVWRPEIAIETRRDNDANILVFPADFIDEETAKECVKLFISTPFSQEEKHVRRLEKISSLEKNNL